MAPGHIPAKDFLCGVEKAIVTLPEETAEEIRQETGSSKALVSPKTTSLVPNGEPSLP
jgi:hypothetical protein